MSVILGLNGRLIVDSELMSESELEIMLKQTSKLVRIADNPLTYTSKGTPGKYFQDPENEPKSSNEMKERYPLLRRDSNNQKGRYSLIV